MLKLTGKETTWFDESEFAGTLADLAHAAHAPGSYYSSPDVYELEVEKVFRKEWIFAARTDELPEPGDYISRRFGDEAFIIARNSSGELHAFYNMCAHRGAEVACESGNARNLQCPYHGWTYDLDGRLIGAARMADSQGFDKSDFRLRPLHLSNWSGNLFVSFNPDPPPFEPIIARFAAEYTLFRQEACKSAYRIVTDLDCNWKLAVENLMDIYHVDVLHASTFGKNIKQQGAPVTLSADGGYHSWFTGKPSTPGGKMLLAPFPWLTDKPEGISCNGFMPPNFFVHARYDCIKVFTVWPRGHEQCSIITYHLFPAEFSSLPNYTEATKIYHDYQILIYEEDRTMIQSLQKAMASPAFVPGRMSTMETQIHNFINGHLRKLFE